MVFCYHAFAWFVASDWAPLKIGVFTSQFTRETDYRGISQHRCILGVEILIQQGQF